MTLLANLPQEYWFAYAIHSLSAFISEYSFSKEVQLFIDFYSGSNHHSWSAECDFVFADFLQWNNGICSAVWIPDR